MYCKKSSRASCPHISVGAERTNQIFSKVKRNHRLDIRLQFTAFVLHADIPVVIHLDGQRDEISDRIGQLLGEISIACQNRLVKEQRDNTSANSKL